jgi:hypothetical protein
VQTPPGARVTNATWSPDSASVAYLAHTEDATTLWVADVATGKSRQLTKTALLATLVTSVDFSADGKHIAAVLIPEGRAPMPQAPTAPTGPTVKIADSDKNRLRTFPSLMSTTYEKELLEWHATGHVALIDVQKGIVKKIGQPVMARAADPSPDGKYVRVAKMTKPFSYDVPVSSFGQVEEVWDATAKCSPSSPTDPSTSASRTIRNRRPTRPPPAEAAAGISRASASSRGGPTARDSRISSRSRHRRAPAWPVARAAEPLPTLRVPPTRLDEADAPPNARTVSSMAAAACEQSDRRAADVSRPRRSETSAPIRPTRCGCTTR